MEFKIYIVKQNQEKILFSVVELHDNYYENLNFIKACVQILYQEHTRNNYCLKSLVDGDILLIIDYMENKFYFENNKWHLE